jgi:hypothetical protein
MPYLRSKKRPQAADFTQIFVSDYLGESFKFSHFV